MRKKGNTENGFTLLELIVVVVLVIILVLLLVFMKQ